MFVLNGLVAARLPVLQEGNRQEPHGGGGRVDLQLGLRGMTSLYSSQPVVIGDGIPVRPANPSSAGQPCPAAPNRITSTIGSVEARRSTRVRFALPVRL